MLSNVQMVRDFEDAVYCDVYNDSLEEDCSPWQLQITTVLVI